VTTPAATPSPAAAPEGSHHHANAKRDRYTGSVVSRRRVVDGWVRVYRRPIYNGGVVSGHIDDLGIGLLDDDRALILDHLCLDLLLLVTAEVSLVLGFLAHALDGFHHVVLLRKEGVAKIGRPLNVIGEALD